MIFPSVRQTILVLSNWSLMGCVQRQLHNREMQTWVDAIHCSRGPRVSTDQPRRGLSKTIKDAEKAAKDYCYRIILEFRKRWLQGKDMTEAYKIRHGMEMANRKGKIRWKYRVGGSKKKKRKYFWYITFLNSRTGDPVHAKSLVLKCNWARSWKKNLSRSKHQL